MGIVELGAILKQIRQAKGMTLKEVAGRLGHREAWLCRLENGQRELKTATLISLCRIYDIKPDRIVHMAEEQSDSFFARTG